MKSTFQLQTEEVMRKSRERQNYISSSKEYTEIIALRKKAQALLIKATTLYHEISDEWVKLQNKA